MKTDLYELGYDAGFNGPNATNCDFRIFSSSEGASEWERGNRDGEAAKVRSVGRGNENQKTPLVS